MNTSVWICLPKSGVKLTKIWMYDMPISHISFSNNRTLQIFIKCFLLHIWKFNTEKPFHLKFVKVAHVVEIDSWLSQYKKLHFLQETQLLFWNTGFVNDMSGFLKKYLCFEEKTSKENSCFRVTISYFEVLQLPIKISKEIN